MKTAAKDSYKVITDSVMSPRLEKAASIVISGIRELHPNCTQELCFHITNDQKVTACARHDGKIYINIEMMRVIYDHIPMKGQIPVDSEDILIAVLNHEAIHIAEEHHLKRTGIMTLATSIIDDYIRPIAKDNKYIEAGAQVTSKLLSQAYSREEEKRADLGAVRLLKAQKRNPIAMATFLQLINTNYQKPLIAHFPIARWFLEHPDIQERIDRCIEAAK